MKDIWQVWPSALSAQECDEIINRAQTYPAEAEQRYYAMLDDRPMAA
jgi:hypothetical protein